MKKGHELDKPEAKSIHKRRNEFLDGPHKRNFLANGDSKQQNPAKNIQQPNNLQKPQREYNDTKQYKPTGSLIYDPKMFEKIERKVSF